MMEKNITERIQAELTSLKADEVRLDNDYKYKWKSGMAIYDMIQDLKRIRKRQVELEVGLKILEEFT